MREALLWEPDGDRIHCLLCPHDCRIADGARGICGVRENERGTLRALTYGLVSSVAVDPIEKKPVFHYRPGTLALSLGSVGCSMRCSHCQNWQISRTRPGEDARLDRLPAAEVPELALEHRCEGVAFTYNEPVIWIEYVLDAARAAKEAGLYTVMVTNGYITTAGLDLIGEVIDVWRVDVKGFSDRVYRELCKARSIRPVLEAAERAHRHPLPRHDAEARRRGGAEQPVERRHAPARHHRHHAGLRCGGDGDPKQRLDQYEMPGTGNGQPLGKTLDKA